MEVTFKKCDVILDPKSSHIVHMSRFQNEEGNYKVAKFLFGAEDPILFFYYNNFYLGEEAKSELAFAVHAEN